VYNAELEYIKGEVEKGNTLLIAPSEDLKIGRIEMKPEKLKKVHQLGREACLRQLSEIKSFLHQTGNFF
jgi:predicted patatin/cPLA2 family phospholipase